MLTTQAPNAESAANQKYRSAEYYRQFDRILAARYVHMQRKKRALAQNAAPGTYVPRMDLCDDETLPRIAAMFELPGVKRESIRVHVQDNALVVEGERPAPLASHLTFAIAADGQGSNDEVIHSYQNTNDPSKGSLTSSSLKYKVRELKFGRFRRVIELPKGVTSKDISAELNEGMLLLSWPRLGTQPHTTSSTHATHAGLTNAQSAYTHTTVAQ